MIDLPQDLDWRFPFCPQPPDWSLAWEAIEGQFPWLQAMKDCPQDPVWHAEGDVLTHTRMVCEALVSLASWRELNSLHRSIVFAAALLHDIAKPIVTRSRDGRISAPKHASKGAQLARELLYKSLLTTTSQSHLAVREQIVGLVCHHGLPLYLLNEQDPKRRTISTSLACRCDWLALVAEADVLGRRCHDKQELLDRIQFFRQYCIDNRCFKGPRYFATDHTRYLYLNGRDIVPDFEAFDSSCCEVTVMSGLPGSGKDTWMRKFAANISEISLDRIRHELEVSPESDQGKVAQRARDLAREYLRASRPFIWNATNLTKTVRENVCSLLSAYRARIKIVYIETSWEKLLERNNTRTEKMPSRVLHKLAGKMEFPTAWEATTLCAYVN